MRDVMRTKAVRVSTTVFWLCLLLIAACERRYRMEPEARTSVADEAASAVLPESKNPRCLGSAYINGEIRCEEFRVSIVELLSNSAQWHDKEVVVIGFAAVGFEHSAIYIHREDSEAGIMPNGLWLEFPNDFSPAELAKGAYVLVRGKFDAKAGGHMNGFNGTIRATKVQLWGP